MGSEVFDRLFDPSDEESVPSARLLSPEQAQAIRAYLGGSSTATNTAARLSQLASKSQTHERARAVVYSSFLAVNDLALYYLIDFQPRLIELIQAMRSLPAVPNPERENAGKRGYEDINWNGDSGLQAWRIEMSETLLASGADDDCSRALFAWGARLQATGDDELRNWSTFAFDCVKWIPVTLERSSQPGNSTQEDTTAAAPTPPSPTAVSSISQLFIHGMAPFILHLCLGGERIVDHKAQTQLSKERWDGWAARLKELSQDTAMGDQARSDANAAVEGMGRAVAAHSADPSSSHPSITSAMLKSAWTPGRPVEGGAA